MKDRNNNFLHTIKNIIKAILIICSVVAVIAGIFDQTGQAKEKREAKKTGKSIHKMNGPYEQFFKRPLDAFLSTGALIVLSPVLLVTAIVVRLKLGSPVLFTQDRPGKNGKIFKLVKFRTMTDARNDQGNLLPDEDRLPKFGEHLRDTSLDELPELINIVKGDMSIIGPRPLLTRYLPYYTEKEMHRHDVRPGLTGLAQVEGRNFLSWEKRFQYDLKYCSNVSLKNDIKIAWMSVKVVLSHEGVSDRSQIFDGEDGHRYIRIGNKVERYPEPLDVERGQENGDR